LGIGYWVLGIGYWILDISQQPKANSQNPTANSQQPKTNSQNPTANSQQPTTNNQQPIANNQKPTTNNQQPTTMHNPYRSSLTHKLFMVLLLVGGLAFAPAVAQVTTDPPLPTADDRVVITLDASGTELEGYTGEVYVHTGVNILGGGNWQYVIGGWGENAVQPQATRIGTDLYELVIEPNIREFYGVPASQTIAQLAMVFRSADNSRQTRPDIFIDVAEPGLTVSILSPVGLQPIVALGDLVSIRASSNESDSLTLFLGGSWLASTTEGSIEYDWEATEHGRFDILAVAYADDNFVEDSSYVFVRPVVTTAPVPEGMVNGINYVDDQTVTLVLHDPPASKEYVFVIGDFNDWEVGEDNLMLRNRDATHFWLTIGGLEPGREYAFQYLIDGELRIADPYTEKVLDPWNDNEIRLQGRYPGLIPYPTGMTEHPVSVFQTAREPYTWEHPDFTPPAVEDLVIYELLIRDFLAQSTYAQLRDTLGYLQRLGVNAIELMPVMNFEGNQSWGYNPSFFFAADKYYGPRRELKKFIDAAHGMGIAVILDIVWNHSYGQSPLLRMYYDAQGNRPADDNPWYSDQIFANPAMNFGYKFDHGSPHFVEFMDRANRYWLEEYQVDGFRFDLSKGFTTQFKGLDDEWGSNYDQERVDNLIRLKEQIKSVNPNAFVILEHLASNQEETVLANNDMLLWGNLTYSYQEAAMGWLPNSNFDWISYQRRGWDDPHLVGYMESHDEERIVYKNLTYGNASNPQHDVTDLEVALRRAEQVAAFYFPIPGPKMIWQFGELGYDYSINHCPNGDIDPGCRVSNKPVRWDYYDDWRRKRLYDTYAALINLKTSQDVFATRDFSLSLGGAMKRIHLDHETNMVTVLGNFGVTEGEMNPHFQETGTWYEYFTREELEVTDVNQSVTMQPGEYRLYSTVEFPDHGLAVGTGQLTAPADEAVNVYPNPSRTGFWFDVAAGQSDELRLEILTLTGQLIHTAVSEASPGRQSLFWSGHARDGSLAGPGIYIYRLTTGERQYSGKIAVP
jgi:1,4-alpha-glucan branching enzyme